MKKYNYLLILLIGISLLPLSIAQETGCPMNDQLPPAETIQTYFSIYESRDNSLNMYAGGDKPFQLLPGFMNSAGSPDKSALCFVKHYKDIFKLNDPDNELKLSTRWGGGIEKDQFNSTHVSFLRVQDGIELEGSELLFHFEENGAIFAFNGVYRPSFQASTTPTITSQQAIEIAKQDYGSSALSTSTELVFFEYNNVDRLAWKVHYSTDRTPAMIYIIDTEDGKILYRDTGIRYGLAGQGAINNNPYLLLVAGIIILVIIVVLVYTKRK